ncbi:MAG: hypothetical protein L0Z55_02815 [Planctomycetes bacterium]|nr:hypothetical protein [Planctomycetota bacterium]
MPPFEPASPEAAGAAAGSPEDAAPPRRAARLRSSVTFLVFSGALFAFMGGAKGYICNCDAALRYLVAQRIWQDGSTLIKADEPLLSALEIVPRTESGEVISFYGIGQSLTMLPAVAAADLVAKRMSGSCAEQARYLGGQFLFTVLLLPFFSALALACAFILGRRLGLSALHAAWAVVALGFGTYWFYYSKTVDMNIEVSLLALAGLVVYTGGAPAWWRTALASLLMSATFHYRQEFLIPVSLTFAVFAYREWCAGRLTPGYVASLLAPALVLGSLVLWHNYVRSGSVFESFPGYFNLYLAEERSAALRASKPLAPEGLMFGSLPLEYLPLILVSLQKGLLWYSPAFLAGLFALIPGALRWRRALSLGAIPLGAFVLFISSLRWSEFEGGWGPRYLLPATPFLLLALAFAIGPLLERPAWARAIGAAIIAACVAQVALSWDGHNCHLEQNKVLRAELLLSGVPEAEAQARSSSLLVARLRDLGLAPFDPPLVREAWKDPRIAAARVELADRFWWQKLAGKTDSPRLARLVEALGVLLMAAGIALLVRALFIAARR